MFHTAADRGPALTPLPARGLRHFRTSGPAVVTAVVLAAIYVAATVLRVSGAFTHYDFRIVAHFVPLRDHPRMLALVHPLVHLGDAVFIAAFVIVSMMGLWLLGYRHTWAMLAGVLSWPVELGCKSILPQPDGLGSVPASVTLSSLVHGSGTKSVSGWLQHATPDGVLSLAGQAGGLTVNLVSSYPSGTTARATFVLGMLVWISMRADIAVLSELVAILLLIPLSVLGVAMIVYAWHWPSDVLGGYILGFALVALTLAIIRRPTGAMEELPDLPERAAGPHSPHSPLPWVPNGN